MTVSANINMIMNDSMVFIVGILLGDAFLWVAYHGEDYYMMWFYPQ